ncbi:MAG: peptide deformylase [Bacillota bacterium]|nr:peptide deformylase [Bacillota bacterium]
MALRTVVLEGDEILTKKAREVAEITERTRLILDDMLETMRYYDGCGLAAPQVGILRRMFVAEHEDRVYELINPVILETGGEREEDEGCLSLPGMVGTVKRPQRVKIAGLDRYGQPVEYEAEDFLAKIFCHEYDHLDGILYRSKAKNFREIEAEAPEEEEGTE